MRESAGKRPKQPPAGCGRPFQALFGASQRCSALSDVCFAETNLELPERWLAKGGLLVCCRWVVRRCPNIEKRCRQ
eukprot:9318735-Alexandrium_andersonii.AAC.1